MHVFEGALLGDVLAKVGAPAGKAIRGVELVDIVIVEARDGYKVALDLAGCDHKASLDGTNDISRRVDIGCGQAALSFRPREFFTSDGARIIAPEYSVER